jgi:hypothetical protein
MDYKTLLHRHSINQHKHEGSKTICFTDQNKKPDQEIAPFKSATAKFSERIWH